MPIAIEMALLDHNISSFESVNGVITGDTIDLLKLAYIRLVMLDLITRVFKLFDEESKGTIDKLVVKFRIHVLDRLLHNKIKLFRVPPRDLKLIGDAVPLSNKLHAKIREEYSRY